MLRDVIRSQSALRWVQDILGMIAVAVLVGAIILLGAVLVPGR